MLLDTCTFLWLAAEDPCVPVRVRRSLETHAEPVYLSVVSMWEIAAKFSRGQLELASPPSRWVPEARERCHVESLPLTESTVAVVETLPWHHRDPFDRMLVACAIAHGLQLVSPDAAFARYTVRTFW